MQIFITFPGEHAPGPPYSFSCFLISFELVLPKKIRSTKNVEIMLSPFLKFLATPLPALIIGEENLFIGFGPPHFRNASAIADYI